MSATSDPANLIFDISEGNIIIGTNSVTYGSGLTHNYNPTTDNVIITGTTTEYTVTVVKDVSANITLRDVNICLPIYRDDFFNIAAFKIEDDSTGNVNITLEGNNILKGGDQAPGLRKNETTSSGWLTIDGTGSLNAGPDIYANQAGIGADYDAYSYGHIKINGGIITAMSGIGPGHKLTGHINICIINGGSVKSQFDMDQDTTYVVNSDEERRTVDIKNENGEKVYLLELSVGNNAKSVLIDNKSYPTNHDSDGKIYVWLTGESHEVIVNNNIIKQYNFDNELKRFVSVEENKFIISATNSSDTLIEGIDYTYEQDYYRGDRIVNFILTILSEKPITITNTDPMISTHNHRIQVKKDISANITLNGVNVDTSVMVESPKLSTIAFRTEHNSIGNVHITLAKDSINTLKSGRGAGLQKDGDFGTLTIDGEGALIAEGVSGIGGGHSGRRDFDDADAINNGNGSNIIINGGIITAIAHDGAGIGGGIQDDENVSSANGSNITINGGIINILSKCGAGIGGGEAYESNRLGGCGSDITINDGIININAGSGAGIGGGEYGNGTDILINGGIISINSLAGAGIGGGIRDRANTPGGNGSNIIIRDGMINITQNVSGASAAIGGAFYGNGTDIIISGGNIITNCCVDTIDDIYGFEENVACIGNGCGNTDSSIFSTSKEDGTPGNAWIETNTNITDNADTSNWSGIIFQGNEGKVYSNQILTCSREISNEKTLIIPSDTTLIINKDIALATNGTLNNEGTLMINNDGTLDGTGTINGNGQFLTANLSVAEINTPTDLYYTGDERNEYIAQNTSLNNKTYLNKEFQIIGWTQQSVTKNNELEYIVTYTSNESEPVSKPVVLSQSGTSMTVNLTNDKVEYAYNDNIVITGNINATGAAPMMLLTEPTEGQVVAYKGATQVSEPVTPSEDGSYSLTIPARNVGLGTNTLTVKYVANQVMAQKTVDVSVTVDVPEGVTVANGSSTYTFKTNITTNKFDVIVPNTTFNYNIAPATESELINGIKSGIGTPIVSQAVFTTTDTLTDNVVQKDTTVNFADVPFTAAGTYRYVLQESLNEEVSGLVLDNSKHYLDVYIENNTDGTLKFAYYVLSTESGDKVDSFNNQYDVFSFTVGNTVTGNSGDKLKDFTYTITFDNATIKNANIVANGAVIRNADTLADEETPNNSTTYIALLKDSESVEFKNVPKSAKFSITESDNTGYTTTISKTGNDDSNIVDDATSTFSDLADGITDNIQLMFTNNKDSLIPTGINLAMSIPVAIGVIIVGTIVTFIFVKKKDYVDVD